MNKQMLTELAKYSEQYVAISDNQEIIASAGSIKDLESKLKAINVSELTIRYITPIDKFISPVCLL